MNYPFKTQSFLHISSWSSCLNFQSYLVAVKTSSKSNIRNSVKTPSPFLDSWRTWRFLINLEMVSYDMYQSYEVALKISSKSNIRNPVKTLLVLIVPSWSLGGHVGFLTTLRKCHMTCVNPLKML